MWLQKQVEYRRAARASIAYNGSAFDRAATAWTQTSWVQPQMHPFDRYFYDENSHVYTPGVFFDDLMQRYGGIDSVLLWATYPGIGLDDRNQYDLTRLAPPGLVEAIDALRARGVRVLLPLNPWDTGTRAEGVPDYVALPQLCKDFHADGINGDTMDFVSEDFALQGDAIGHPIAIEPELGGTLEMLNWATLGWGYWDTPKRVLVDRWKWLEPRRMTHVCNRWAFDKTDDLQYAWFNGDGYESWENVWGTWNGITPRDSEAIRRYATMARFFGPGFLVSQGWQPHFPTVNADDVFASKWPAIAGADVLFTLVNRGSADSSGRQLVLNTTARFFYDCYHGRKLIPEVISETSVALSFTIESGGFGAVLATYVEVTPGDPSGLGQLLKKMQEMTENPLSSFDHTWKYLSQTQVPIKQTPRNASTPDGMVRIPKGMFQFVSKGIEIEGDDAHGVDIQMPGESYPRRNHNQNLQMSAFFIDKYPVTNSQFAAFLSQSGYSPKDARNFLKFWKSGKVPTGDDNKPVTWISVREARMYCAWAGKRLPHETEWQYAAQGTDGRLYPWGSTFDQSKFPVQTHGRVAPGPENVMAHSPAGDSPFGVADLVGNVWQLTDEYQDVHTRAIVLKGGSNYRPQGSDWYFPNSIELTTHNKLLLFDDAFERAATLGFRCAADAL